MITVVVRAARGMATPGDVVLFVAATAGVQAAFSGTIAQLGIMTKAVRLFQHYRAVVTAEDDLPDGDRAVAPLTSGIVFRDVWFRYDEDSDRILRGFDLTIPAGSACALVGVNGAGKSTLVKLLCRFYDPTRGSITWERLRPARPAHRRVAAGPSGWPGRGRRRVSLMDGMVNDDTGTAS